MGCSQRLAHAVDTDAHARHLGRDLGRRRLPVLPAIVPLPPFRPCAFPGWDRLGSSLEARWREVSGNLHVTFPIQVTWET